MEIQLTNAGKRFRFDWIFKDLNFQFLAGNRCAVLGPNGSGKSTLLKVISGHLSPTKGKCQLIRNGQPVDPDSTYRHVAYAAPYIELIEEFTLEEALLFHSRLKPLMAGMTPAALYERLELPKTRRKEIRFFSSGMKQRLKLALAICSDTPVLLLDEPTTNLDVHAVAWYKNLLEQFTADRIVILASNDPADLDVCNRQLNIPDYR
jgi:ABC-type multidrug transport system ATPase subunit